MSLNQKTIEEYIERGKEFIIKGKEKEWENCVKARVNDLYGGIEVKNALEITESYRDKKDEDVIKKIFDDEGHSGMSASLVFAIIEQLFTDGSKIVKIIRE